MALQDDYEDPYGHEQLSDDAAGAVAVNVTEGIGQEAPATAAGVHDDEDDEPEPDAGGDVPAPGAEGVVEEGGRSRGDTVDFAVRPSGIRSQAPRPRRPIPEAVSDDVIVDADAAPMRRNRASRVIRTAFGLSDMGDQTLDAFRSGIRSARQQADLCNAAAAAKALNFAQLQLNQINPVQDPGNFATGQREFTEAAAYVSQSRTGAECAKAGAELQKRTDEHVAAVRAGKQPPQFFVTPAKPVKPTPGMVYTVGLPGYGEDQRQPGQPSPWRKRLLIGGGVLLLAVGGWFAWTRWFRKT